MLYIQCEFKLNSTHYDTGNNNSKKTRKPKGRSFIIYHCYVTRQYILTLSIYITDKNKGNSVTKRQAEDPISTPKRSSRKVNESTTPQSNTSTLSTKSTTSSGTTASLRKNVARAERSVVSARAAVELAAIGQIAAAGGFEDEAGESL